MNEYECQLDRTDWGKKRQNSLNINKSRITMTCMGSHVWPQIHQGHLNASHKAVGVKKSLGNIIAGCSMKISLNRN